MYILHVYVYIYELYEFTLGLSAVVHIYYSIFYFQLTIGFWKHFISYHLTDGYLADGYVTDGYVTEG